MTHLFRFLRADLWWDVLEGLGGGRAVVVQLLDGAVGLRWQPDVLRLDVDDDEDGLGAVFPDQVVYDYVVLWKEKI